MIFGRKKVSPGCSPGPPNLCPKKYNIFLPINFQAIDGPLAKTLDSEGREAAVDMIEQMAEGFKGVEETDTATRTLTKAFNVIGVPVLVVVLGLLVWLRRTAHKKRIQALFMS